jgi:DNA-binding NarL/FixJ family response regulator
VAAPGELTPRQLEVARLAAQGLKRHEIAGRLMVSPATVSAHVQQVHRRTGTRNRAQVRDWLAAQGPPGGESPGPAVK